MISRAEICKTHTQISSVLGESASTDYSGEVIETATRKVLTTLPTLAQTKKSIEVDWQGGVPVATSGRSGVGGVG